MVVCTIANGAGFFGRCDLSFSCANYHTNIEAQDIHDQAIFDIDNVWQISLDLKLTSITSLALWAAHLIFDYIMVGNNWVNQPMRTILKHFRFLLFYRRSLECPRMNWWSTQLIHFGCVYVGFASYYSGCFGLLCWVPPFWLYWKHQNALHQSLYHGNCSLVFVCCLA